MPTYNKPTLKPTQRKKNFIATSILTVLVLAVAATVIAVTLAEPKDRGRQDPPVSTAIVFGLPVSSYTRVLKNASLTELQYNSTMLRWESHKMVTLEAPLGTPVLACFAGTVASVNDHSTLGRQITIEHRDGLKTVYSNLDKNTKVVQGQRVEKGTQIGQVGQTSSVEFINTPHLRIAVYKDGKRIDPNDYIDFPIK